MTVYVKNMFLIAMLWAVANSAAANCMSYSTEIPLGKDVCFSSSMRQYSCVKIRGAYGLDFVQRLTFRSSLDSCYHVDRHNDRAAFSDLIGKIDSVDVAPTLALASEK